MSTTTSTSVSTNHPTMMNATLYTTADIAGLLPELNEITDLELRDRVARVWDEAIRTGCGGKGWSFDELRAVKFTLLAGDIDLTYIDHLRSCAR